MGILSFFTNTSANSGAVSFPLWRKYFKYIYYGVLLMYLFVKRVNTASEEVNGAGEKPIGRYQVATFNFDHVSDIYAITLWILLGSLAKVGFHLSHKLTEKFPESCLLIILGLVVGILLYATKLAEQKAYVLNSDTFFLFLLPPIILEAGYFMPNRPFFDNIGTILLFAIANTLFNTISIGLTLWGFSFTSIYGGTEFEMLHCFVFAALISAVDPVAVLATFVEIHVNDMLYIVVFGESLLNDAVSVVLYRMFDQFAGMGQENVLTIDLVLGASSFFVVAIGGVLTGIVFGILASFTTKFTEHTPVLEPLIIITYSYLSYLTAEMFSTSGILAITFCGMFMKQYVEFNISKKSNATIEYVFKMLASIMETIIFMFMGLSTISDHHSWNTGFVILTLVCCTVYRIIGVIIFANIANRWRLLELTATDMLIMSYGGIRGAVAFALALILDESKIPRKKEFVTATIAVVFFTVFVQGTTIGPIVKYLKVKRKEVEEPTMSAKLTNRLIDHIMSCLEDIAGVSGRHSLRDKIRTYDRKFLKAFLLREKFLSKDDKLLNTFKKINELNVNKMAENPDFVFPSSASMAQLHNMRNVSIGNFLSTGNYNRPLKLADPSHGLNEISTVPDFSILGSQPSKRAEDDAQFHHLLDNAMYEPRRTQTIHKRSQLNDDPYTKRMGNHGFLHHQNPLLLRSLIETSQSQRSKSMPRKRTTGTRDGQTATNKPRSSSTNSGDRAKIIKEKGTQSKTDTTTQPKKIIIKTPETSLPTAHPPPPPPASIISTPSTQTDSKNDNNKIVITASNENIVEKKSQPPPSPTQDSLPPPWKSFRSVIDTSNDEPIKAHMPSWANNPDYTLHATTTKPDENLHKPIFDIFKTDDQLKESEDDLPVKDPKSKDPTTKF